MRDDYRSVSDDHSRGEQEFAAQLLRAIQQGYEASWNENSGFLIHNSVGPSTIRVATSSFFDHPSQAAEVIRQALDSDEINGRVPRGLVVKGEATVGAFASPYRRTNPYAGWTSTLFGQGGDHIADRCS